MNAKSQAVEYRSPGELIPYATNPKGHSRRQQANLVAMIEEFGFASALAVDEHDVLLAGHARREAALALGLERIPVMRISGLSDAQKKAFRIADNRITEEGAWNEDLLLGEFRELIDVDYNVELTGFETGEIDRLLNAEPLVATADEEPLPELPDEPVSRPGDHWLAGSHHIVCGDCREAATVEAAIADGRPTAVFTDPPWNVSTQGHIGGKGKTRHRDFAVAGGEMTDAEFRDFMTAFLGNASAWTKDGGLLYICIDWRNIARLIAAGESTGLTLLNLVVWAKPNPGMGSFYRSQHELIAVFKKGKGRHTNNIRLGAMGRNRSNLWHYLGASGFSKTRQRDLRDHPTVKPVALVANAIKDATNIGESVLDLFGGSGTTMLAAELTNRRAHLVEIEPRFVDVALRRFRDQTGVAPLLLPDRLPFEDVRQKRAAG